MSVRSRWVPFVFFLLVVGGFIAGMIHLISLRFEAGDVYPPYSSLRSDPLGAMVLYEALDQLDTVQTERFMKPLSELERLDAGVTVVMAGLPSDYLAAFDERRVKALESVAIRGGRVVLLLYPDRGWKASLKQEIQKGRQEAAGESAKRTEEKAEDAGDDASEAELEADTSAEKETAEQSGNAGIENITDSPGAENTVASDESEQDDSSGSPLSVDEESPAADTDSQGDDTDSQEPGTDDRHKSKRHANALSEDRALLRRLQFEVGFFFPGDVVFHHDDEHPSYYQANYVGPAQDGVSALPTDALPSSLLWYGQAYIKNPGPRWTVLYAADGEYPVVVEGRLGAGSIVIATDSYLLSNEAMHSDRHLSLLTWLTGGNSRVVFVETHHGLSQSRGIAALGKTYRLHGVFLAIILFGLLFVWRNASSLLPPEGPELRQHAEGRGHDSAMSGLLQRNIQRRQVLPVCLQEWERTFPARSAAMPTAMQEAYRIAHAADIKPHEAYNQITKILDPRKVQ